MDLEDPPELTVPEFASLREATQTTFYVHTRGRGQNIKVKKGEDMQAAIAAAAWRCMQAERHTLSMAERIFVALAKCRTGTTMLDLWKHDVYYLFGERPASLHDLARISRRYFNPDALPGLVTFIGESAQLPRHLTLLAVTPTFHADLAYHAELWCGAHRASKFGASPDAIRILVEQNTATLQAAAARADADKTAFAAQARVVWLLELAKAFTPDMAVAATPPQEPAAAAAAEEDSQTPALLPCQDKPGWVLLTSRFSYLAAHAFHRECMLTGDGVSRLHKTKQIAILDRPEVVALALDFCTEAESYLANGYRLSTARREDADVDSTAYAERATKTTQSRWVAPDWANLRPDHKDFARLSRSLTADKLNLFQETQRVQNLLRWRVGKHWSVATDANGRSVCTVSSEQYSRSLLDTIPGGDILTHPDEL